MHRKNIREFVVESQQNFPLGYVRLVGRSYQPLQELTEIELYRKENSQTIELGVFNAEIGAPWHDETRDTSGWYYFVGPVPESIL